nr:MAG TPA: hypothetical protein [Caudoviricetes sp.]
MREKSTCRLKLSTLTYIQGADMEIKIYNRDLTLKGIIEDHTSLLWHRKYYEPGTFELTAPITEHNVNVLTPESIIYKSNSIEAGVIESLKFEESGNIKKIVAKGRYLSSYFERRLIKSTVFFKGKVKDAFPFLIRAATPIPNIEVGELKGNDKEVTFQATYKNLLTYMQKLSKYSGIGFKLIPDLKSRKMIFETYEGKNRTFNQRENSRVIFSESYENLGKCIYSYSSKLYKNVCYVGGEGEGAARKIIKVGETVTGFDLREVFFNAASVKSNGLTALEYENALKQKGNEKLEACAEVDSFEPSVDPEGNFLYKKDYDLGDIIVVQKESWGMKKDMRITEIQEIYEHEKMIIEPTFGNPVPEKIDWSDK